MLGYQNPHIKRPYFPVLGLNTEIYSVNVRIQSEYREYGPEKTPYLDTFHSVMQFIEVKENVLTVWLSKHWFLY